MVSQGACFFLAPRQQFCAFAHNDAFRVFFFRHVFIVSVPLIVVSFLFIVFPHGVSCFDSHCFFVRVLSSVSFFTMYSLLMHWLLCRLLILFLIICVLTLICFLLFACFFFLYFFFLVTGELPVFLQDWRVSARGQVLSAAPQAPLQPDHSRAESLPKPHICGHGRRRRPVSAAQGPRAGRREH